MKNEKHFTRDDIKHVYTATIQLAIAAGWSIHPWTMNGSQGEICKVHMEKDGELRVIYMDTFHDYDKASCRSLDGVKMVIGHKAKGTWNDSSTIWLDKLDRVEETRFYMLGNGCPRTATMFTTDATECLNLQCVGECRRDIRKVKDSTLDHQVQVTPSIVALVRKRVKGCKTIKASQVVGVRSVYLYYNGGQRKLIVDLGTKGRHSIRFARG